MVLAEEGVEGELEYGDEEEAHEGVDDPHLIRFEVHVSLREKKKYFSIFKTTRLNEI